MKATTIKTSVIYIALFFAILGANHLYYQSKSTTDLVTPITGDWSKFGVTESHNIVAFTATWCDACKSFKQYMAENSIAYINKDIEQNPLLTEQLNKYGAKSLPIILINDKIYQGFSDDMLDVLLIEHGIK